MAPVEWMMYLSTAMAITVFAIPLVLLSLAIPYAILRLRDSRNPTPDPQLGFKVAMQYFFSVSLLLVLFGLTTIVVDLILRTGGPRFGPEDFPTEGQRTGFAMILSGGIFALIHFLCLVTLTSSPFNSPVRRTFLGCRVAVHGLMVLTAGTMLLIGLFQRPGGGADEIRRSMLGILLVWTPSWIVHLVLLRASPATTTDREPTWTEGEREREWER
ncbi:MAG TPA: hypothetical protein VEL76_32905 [Gemmataceae bacterium]|nr:hypothetical protein [Gemmataceae bacterium]